MKMYTFIALSAFVLVVVAGAENRRNDDCVNYDKCPVALDLALNKRDDTTIALFKNATCGYDGSGKKTIPMVYCSSFEDYRMDNHANLKLLPANCGNIKSDRIFGGKKADLYEFPWMAQIYHNTRDGVEFKCGGSILNSRYVLTAAHCVYNKNIARIRIGEYNMDEDNDCRREICESHIQDVQVEKAIIHEGYMGMPRLINDIALLRVVQPIEFGHKNVQAICLPKTARLRNEPLENVLATVTGWGLTETGTHSSVLLKVIIPIHTAEGCSSLYNRYSKPGEPDATANQLCAGTLNKDSCNGDSGGPLVYEREYDYDYRFVQYGVVSHGPQKCGSDFPGVYTDVTKYMGWILDNMSP